MSSNDDDLLNWLAMQYVLGEMSEPDREEFELRLANDLIACEAVAKATRLTLALRSALAESGTSTELSRSPIHEARRSRMAVGISIAAIACVFLVMIFWSGNARDSTESNLVARPNNEAFELVSRWRTDGSLADDDDDDDDNLDEEVHDNGADLAVPGWILAGVLLEKHGALDVHADEL